MKKDDLILLAAGVILAGLIIAARKKKGIETILVLKPGDKGNEVYGLQNALSKLTGVRLSNMGVYDNETLAAVQYYMKDSKALYDYDKGYVDSSFGSDLYSIQNKLNQNL